MSPAGGEEWKVLVNRGLALLAILVTAVFASLAKKATLKLAENERNLERLVEQRTEELKRSNSELENSNVELKQFAYVASHDLQTPLRAIHGFAEFLKEDASDQLDEEANNNLDRIISASNRMKTLINDLLSYSHLENSTSHFKRVDLNRLFDGVVDLLAVDIKENTASVTRESLPQLEGDRGQLRQLLQNLIENALKYRGERAPEVHVSATHDGEHWLVSVEDNGIGIAPEYHERVFEIFRRLHDSKTYPGTGIGLAVCRRIVDRHQGRIWIDNNPKGGTTVTFAIPGHLEDCAVESESATVARERVEA